MKRHIHLFAAVLILGCGGAKKEEPEVVSVEDYESSTFTVEAKDPSVQGLLGTVTDDEIQRVFNDSMRSLLKCYEDAVFELEEIEGNLRFGLEVASDGSVNHAFISESNLGSLETEGCMLQRIRRFHFQRQPGGVAILSYPLELIPPYDHPPPKVWSREQLGSVLDEHRGEIANCLRGGSGAVVTLYIGQGGVVLSAGAAAADMGAFDGAVCVARAARGWTFSDPGDDLIKVGLDF